MRVRIDDLRTCQCPGVGVEAMSHGRSVRLLADGFSFLEGPRWHEGEIYASDFYTHRVHAFDTAGAYRLVCEVAGQPSGLGFLPDGSMLVVSMTDRRVLRLASGRLEEYANLSVLAPFHTNDMLVDNAGRAYVGNFGWDLTADPRIHPTRLILLAPGSPPVPVAEDLAFPNGVVTADDGRTLLVCETFAARITAFDRAKDGTLSNRRPWADFAHRRFKTVNEAIESGCPLPDGMAIDAEGAVWIGDAAGRGSLRVVEGGRIVERIDTGGLSVYAVALGGAKLQTLYMCASPPLFTSDPSTDHRACLLACEVDTPAPPAGAR